jgi:hypothetical protein
MAGGEKLAEGFRAGGGDSFVKRAGTDGNLAIFSVVRLDLKPRR